MANSRSFPTGIAGNTAGTTPATGNIGELYAAAGNASAATGSDTSIVTLTLPVGVWSVSGGLQSDNAATQTGYNALFFQKNINTATFAVDFCFARYTAGQAASCSFIPRILVIAAADSNKTIEIKARSITTANTCYGYLTAIRVA